MGTFGILHLLNEKAKLTVIYQIYNRSGKRKTQTHSKISYKNTILRRSTGLTTYAKMNEKLSYTFGELGQLKGGTEVHVRWTRVLWGKDSPTKFRVFAGTKRRGETSRTIWGGMRIGYKWAGLPCDCCLYSIGRHSMCRRGVRAVGSLMGIRVVSRGLCPAANEQAAWSEERWWLVCRGHIFFQPQNSLQLISTRRHTYGTKLIKVINYFF